MKLPRRNWSKRNHDTLGELLAEVRPGEIAVFDWDNTCIFGDIGEALLRQMTFTLSFKIESTAMAEMIPAAINGIDQVLIAGEPFPLEKIREAIVLAYRQLKKKETAADRPRFQECYRTFTSGLLALNRALEETPGIGCEFAYPWVNILLQGLAPAELAGMAEAVIAHSLREPLRHHAVNDPQKRWRYGWQGGVRLYPEMQELAAAWSLRGGAVVVSTASNRQLVEKMTAMTGFPCRQVIGMELALAGGRFGRALKPGLRPNLGAGKVANIHTRLRGEPVLVAGDSSNDFEMLTAFTATRTRLVIDRQAPGRINDLIRRAHAGEPGWLVQGSDRRRGTFKADSKAD